MPQAALLIFSSAWPGIIGKCVYLLLDSPANRRVKLGQLLHRCSLELYGIFPFGHNPSSRLTTSHGTVGSSALSSMILRSSRSSLSDIKMCHHYIREGGDAVSDGVHAEQANTTENDQRDEDELWKELISGSFYDMLRSVLPEMARAADTCIGGADVISNSFFSAPFVREQCHPVHVDEFAGGPADVALETTFEVKTTVQIEGHSLRVVGQHRGIEPLQPLLFKGPLQQV